MAWSWQPSAAQVHAEIPQRGIPGEGFTTESQPTAAQVEEIAGHIAVEVVGTVGGFDASYAIDTDPQGNAVTLGDLAGNAAALGTASRIEDQFYPEQQTGDYMGMNSTPSQHLYARYQRALELLKSNIERWRRNGRPPAGTVRTVPGMVRMGRSRT